MEFPSKNIESQDIETSEAKGVKIGTDDPPHAFYLRPELLDLDNIRRLAEAFASPADKKFSELEVSVSHDPFSFCVVDNFLQGTSIPDLTHRLKEMNFERKQTDRIQLFQSEDLAQGQEEPLAICAVKRFLRDEVMPWVGELTGTKLESLNLTCYKFGHTDFSLCSNGQEGQLVRFVLNLGTENWTKEDGGAWELLGNSNGEAAEVCQTLLPKTNSFLFYKITPVSFVQMSEVLNKDKIGLAIVGTFGAKEETATEDAKDAEVIVKECFKVINNYY